MKNLVTFTTLIILSFSINPAFAKIYKCQAKEQITFQSEPCPVDESSKTKKTFFGFDGWKFGTRISEMKIMSQNRDLGVSPGTLHSSRSYNRKTINSKPSARTYNYWTKVMGKSAKVSMYFTKITKELYQVKVMIMSNQSTREEKLFFLESIHNLLTSKYGKPQIKNKNTSKNITFATLIGTKILPSSAEKLLVWGNGSKNVVTMPYRKKYSNMLAYPIGYSFMPLVIQNKKETTFELRSRTKSAITLDGGKL